MELMVPLDVQSERPLYEQIYQYIKEEIREGRMAAGERLPSTRVLAQNLKVSRSTTQLAYDQLLAEGYAEAFPCRGYFVCGIEELASVRQQPGAPLGAAGESAWKQKKFPLSRLEPGLESVWISRPGALIWSIFPLIPGGS